MQALRKPGSYRHERGAVLLIGAAAMTALIMVSALVVDIGLAKTDRSQNRLAADAVATAGAFGLGEGGGVGACESAIGYVTANLGELPGLSCSGFPSSCNAATAVASTTGTSEGTTVTIVYPVSNNHELMTPASRGTQALSVRDGSQCQRVGVRVDQSRAALFSQIVGNETLDTSVHSVALRAVPDAQGDVVSLLLIEKHECPALSVNGGGSSGGIYVSGVVDPMTGNINPGRIAVDSDGTVGCGSSTSTILTTGNGANIHAYGAPGCAGELSPNTGAGCGVIEAYADGAPGCNPPACSGADGTVSPAPSQSTQRRTRAPFDWRFNCKASYPASYEIDGCPDTGSRSSYIDDLVLDTVNLAGANPFEIYSDHFDCRVKSRETVIVPVGNWLIDCAPLKVQGGLDFDGGNIVVDGDIEIGSQGFLRVNNANNDSNYSWISGSAATATEHSAGAAFIFFRDGTLSKSGGGGLSFMNSMVYLSPTSGLEMVGGTGEMTWIAPTEGPFEDLALWSESEAEVKLSGQATLELEGIVFVPNAEVSFQGNGSIANVEAQFVAKKVSTGGNGSLQIAPVLDRSIAHPPTGSDIELIR